MVVSTKHRAPATLSQPSRKGKRAWRKNVDLSDIQSGLESARDQVIQTGGQLLADLPASALFQTDTQGSAQIKAKAHGARRQLKVDEILSRRSAVPAVNTRKRSGDDATVTDGVLEPTNKRRRGNGVSHAKLQHLRAVAYGGSALHTDIVSTGDVATHDLWAESISVAVPETLSFLETNKSVIEPKTLKSPPVSLTVSGKIIPHVLRPAAGRSYNPSFADWTSLLEREGAKESSAEQRRIGQAEAEAARLERIAIAAAEAEREDMRAAAASEYDESEWEGIQSEMEELELKRKKPERMTPAQRNKAKRKKEAQQLAKHDRKMQQRDEQLKQIAAIRRSLDSKLIKKSTTSGISSMKPTFPGSVQSSENEGLEEDFGEILRRRKFGKVPVLNASLEVVLQDELQDSLRLLKPEGNLLRDRYRNMLVQGRVEARKAITQPKKAKRKATEKWSYKDWKLPGQ